MSGVMTESIIKTFAFCSENPNVFDSFIRGLNDTITERRGGALRRR